MADHQDRPNVLIITADDMTYNSLGVMGNPMDNITPTIDRLAGEGMLFSRGYVTSPVCGPSRESIFTGRYPVNNGIMPTVLDALDLPEPNDMDGRSFLPLLRNEDAAWSRRTVFTSWDFMDREHHGDTAFDEYRPDLYRHAEQYRPMRALHGQRYVYVWNGWADGETTIPPVMGGEGSTPISLLSAMKDGDAEALYPNPAERVEFYLYRTPEELYDIERDPGGLNNLANDSAYRPIVEHFRGAMLDTLKAHNDHELVNYRQFLGISPE